LRYRKGSPLDNLRYCADDCPGCKRTFRGSKPSPDKTVLRWLAGQNRAAVFTTAITQAEILYGIEMLPSGKRRSRLHTAIERLFADEFPERILPFDRECALVYPKIVGRRVLLGRPISQFDALIASVCPSRDAAIATRTPAILKIVD